LVGAVAVGTTLDMRDIMAAQAAAVLQTDSELRVLGRPARDIAAVLAILAVVRGPAAAARAR
jgi:hypothetical protein